MPVERGDELIGYLEEVDEDLTDSSVEVVSLDFVPGGFKPDGAAGALDEVGNVLASRNGRPPFLVVSEQVSRDQAQRILVERPRSLRTVVRLLGSAEPA